MSLASRGRKVQKVTIVKPRKHKKRRGPRITKLLKDKTVAKLRYVDTITIDAGAAAMAYHTFAANGCHDPDVTGTGHQPLMWDEYKALYGQYRVLTSKLKCTPVLSANVSPYNLYGVIRDDDSTPDYTEATALIEDSRHKGKWGNLTTNNAPNSNSRSSSRSVSFNAKRHLSPEGRFNAIDTDKDPTTSGMFNYFSIWSGSLLGNNPGAISFLVELEYVIEFTSPINVTQS